MRVSKLVSLLAVLVGLMPTVAQADVSRSFELAGVNLLCQQAAPLMVRGLPQNLSEQYQSVLQANFAADELCASLERDVALTLSDEDLAKVNVLLDNPIALIMTEQERLATGPGPEGSLGLATYGAKVAKEPPRGPRVELVKRLDRAAQTSALTSRLRYEVGKTQALLNVLSQEAVLSEDELSRQTAEHGRKLDELSREQVTVFLLYAYRKIPSETLQAYVELYEQPPVKALMLTVRESLSHVFAERRARLMAQAR
ncbi:hypothetical protein [Atopomonas sediminilitoris]|uniref:hypothetical protein n=1 Tax=Atopomonas sediminilitoris TaxID=2919919 RepID=UPI001F4EE7C7|nr:hypothetical protein [Atopomonas sediminilitoris]MCJ8168187.1 hypothetical protein [Atopomonas sediminilitoris]